MSVQWDKVISERIAAQTAEFQTLSKRIAEQAAQLSQQMVNVEAQIAERFAALKKIDLSPLLSQSEEFQRQTALIANRIKELPTRLQQAVLLLADHGWFFDFEMPLSGLWECEKAIAGGDVKAAEGAFIVYFNERLTDIERSVVEQYPHRAVLITAAFRGHRSEEYEMSIPLLLTQVDGICKDAVDRYFFIRERGKGRPSTGSYVDELVNDTFKAALLSPLAVTSEINLSERERKEGFTGLNRHMVMHGESLDYGTRVNSLKTISLLNYVVGALQS